MALGILEDFPKASLRRRDESPSDILNRYKRGAAWNHENQDIECGGVGFLHFGLRQSPDSISPAYVSEVGYQNWSCTQLAEESARLSTALASASVQQENARTTDTVGVILIGLPVSSLSGDNIAPEIARLKGETEAVRKASMSKSCGAPSSPSRPALTTSSIH